MTTQQIKCFLTVAEKLSFTEAARVLYISQPAVSRHVALLEDELGFEFFCRSKTGLELTSAGKKLASYFSEKSLQLEELVKQIKIDADNLSGEVILGSLDGWDQSELISYARQQLLLKYPHIHLTLKCFNHNELMDALTQHSVDLIIEQKEIIENNLKIIMYPVRKISCALYYSHKHPLANRKDLSLKDFHKYPFYVMSTQKNLPELEEYVIRLCRSIGFTPEIELVSTLSSAFIKMLSDNGVFWADTELIQKNNPLYHSILLPFERTLCLGSREGKSEICAIVETILLEYFESKKDHLLPH